MGFHRRGTVAPVATMRTGAAVVSRRDKLDGWDTLYSHGGDTKPALGVPLPPESSKFQPVTVQLAFERLNGFLYRAGQRGFGQSLRAGYLSFKVETRGGTAGTTAGSNAGTGAMRPPKRYTRVQRIPRYNAAPKVYPTKSSP